MTQAEMLICHIYEILMEKTNETEKKDRQLNSVHASKSQEVNLLF